MASKDAMEVKVVVAGNGCNGPCFYPVVVRCTAEQYDGGEHYDSAEETAAEEGGLDGPFVRFDDRDGPPWLFEQFKWTEAIRALLPGTEHSKIPVAECAECGGKGYLCDEKAFANPPLGLPGGWVQRCDACEKFKGDLEAMNHVRGLHGEQPMTAYPCSLVQADHRDSAEQTFFVGIVAAVTLQPGAPTTDGGGVRDIGELCHDLAGLYWAHLQELVRHPLPPMSDEIPLQLEVFDCLPAKFDEEGAVDPPGG